MIEKNLFRKLIILALVALLGVLWGAGPARANTHFLAVPLVLSLEVHELTDSAWILSEMISIQRIHHSQDMLKLRSTDLPHELLGFVYLSVDSGEPQQVGSAWIDVLRNKETSAEIRILLKPEIVLNPPGDYRFTLEDPGNRMAHISVNIKIKDFARILLIDPGVVSIEAAHGPDRYFADSQVFLEVLSNHSKWRVLLSTEGLCLANDEKIKVEPQDLLIAVNDPEQGYRPFTEGIVLNAADFPGRTAAIYLGADTGWNHIAGSYSGVITVTLAQP